MDTESSESEKTKEHGHMSERECEILYSVRHSGKIFGLQKTLDGLVYEDYIKHCKTCRITYEEYEAMHLKKGDKST